MNRVVLGIIGVMSLVLLAGAGRKSSLLLTALSRYVNRHHLPDGADRIVLSVIKTDPAGYRLRRGQGPYQVRSLTTVRRSGRYIFQLAPARAGEPVRVYADLNVQKKIYVYRVDLPARHTLTAAAVKREYRKWSSRRTRRVADRLDGRYVLRRGVKAGSVVKRSHLTVPLLARAGKELIVEYKRGGVHIEMNGKALRGGRRHEIIPVKIGRRRRRVELIGAGRGRLVPPGGNE